VGAKVIALTFADPLPEVLSDLRTGFPTIDSAAITRKLAQPLPTTLIVVGGSWGRRVQTVFKLYRLRVRVWRLDEAGAEDWDTLSDLSARISRRLETMPRRIGPIVSIDDVNGPYPVEDPTGPELRLLTVDCLVRGVE
jgi:hypothetical protein